MQNLATQVAQTYKTLAPEAFENQVSQWYLASPPDNLYRASPFTSFPCRAVTTLKEWSVVSDATTMVRDHFQGSRVAWIFVRTITRMITIWTMARQWWEKYTLSTTKHTLLMLYISTVLSSEIKNNTLSLIFSAPDITGQRRAQELWRWRATAQSPMLSSPWQQWQHCTTQLRHT